MQLVDIKYEIEGFYLNSLGNGTYVAFPIESPDTKLSPELLIALLCGPDPDGILISVVLIKTEIHADKDGQKIASEPVVIEYIKPTDFYLRCA